MARWATQCILGSVDFSGCRVELVSPGGFKSPNVGSADWANDGSVVVQTINRGTKGIPFGLRFASTQQSDLEDLFADIATAESTQSSIRAQIEEGLFDLDLFVTPNYTSNDWFTFDKHSEGWYENVSLLFISQGDYA